jgi:hypothetical protein
MKKNCPENNAGKQCIHLKISKEDKFPVTLESPLLTPRQTPGFLREAPEALRIQEGDSRVTISQRECEKWQ